MDYAKDVQQIVTDQFKGSTFRIAPRDLVGRVRAQRPDLPATEIHLAIKHLVQQGILIYSHRFSTTQLEFNFQRCVGITSRIALCPENFDPVSMDFEVVIRLSCGEAFGLGDHPTTRLALRGIEIALDGQADMPKTTTMKALDIGTGSGVLALAAAKLGVAQTCAIDHDTVARHEAKANVALNGLSAHVEVAATSLEEMPAKAYALIMANLRPPTLRAMFGQMARVARPPSTWVLSGFRSAEGAILSDFLQRKGASILWRETENEWAAMVARLNSEALGGIGKGV